MKVSIFEEKYSVDKDVYLENNEFFDQLIWRRFERSLFWKIFYKINNEMMSKIEM